MCVLISEEIFIHGSWIRIPCKFTHITPLLINIAMSFITGGSGHDYEVYCAKRAVCRAKGAFCRAKYTLGATKVDRATTVPSASVAPAVADVLSRISSEI